MWPLDLPARDVLKLPGETVIPWAEFDWKWYLRTYPEVAGAIDPNNPKATLDYYLDIGQAQGHAPNRMFDEQWHRLVYPQIAERVVQGHCRSAFDAFCRRGALDRSAHWLFDELAYRERYPDLTNTVLAEFEIYNGYDHYLRHGVEEDRIGHKLFDPQVYLANFDPADVAAIRETGVFQHYLNRIESGEPELRTSIYFDPEWYLSRYPEVALLIESGQWKCALHHYLCNDTPTAFDPLESFSESWYLQCDPGLRKVVATGSFRNGYTHFLSFGLHELRSPSASIDLAWYAAQASVRADLEQGHAPDAYAHWLTIGAAAGLPPARPEDENITDTQARYLLHRSAIALLPITGRFGCNFECRGEPAVSVVLVVRDGFAAAVATLASLRSSTAMDIELVVVDRGSDDETRFLGHYIKGARTLRFDSDIGWSRAAEAGRQLAGASTILFLSNDARIAPGSIDRALARLQADPPAGAVGGMILQVHGVIAQAGGILWNDGGIHDYQRGASPLKPEANFTRVVDYCAPECLLVRSDVLAQLDGFDHDCAAGYAGVDLCLRIADAGFHVVYDPSVQVTIGDAIRGGAPGDHFRNKHAAALARRTTPSGEIQVFARHAGPRPHRILFIEDTVPLRRIGSGFVRANDLVQVMASLGHAVTVFPINGCDHDPAHVYGDMPDTVEVMHTHSFDHLAAFMTARPNYYDTVWVARTHNLVRVRPILARLIGAGHLNARIVLDTEAITPHREAMQAAIAGQPYDLDAEMQAIVAISDICQQAVTVTEAEADILRSHGMPDVAVIGHMVEPKPTERAFGQRAGILFVGAVHTADSPNLDSLIWFTEAVLPLIETELKWETRLTIVGYVAPGIDMSRFEHHPRITMRGPVADLGPLYNTHRVFVAPTRYAAGAPYKVLEAASRGVPVVATEVLRDELDWDPGQEIFSADPNDPARFAALVVELYRNEALWQSVRDGALDRLRAEFGRGDFSRAVLSVLSPDLPATS